MKQVQLYSVGQKFYVGNLELRIMAYSEGYYMCRYKGCIPFAIGEKDLAKLIG